MRADPEREAAQIARLRALNKELLEALEGLVQAHDDYNTTASSFMAHLINPAREAIYRAKGEA